MGTLTHYRGDLLKTDRKVLAHGVNCKGSFGSGVAGQIARKFPDVKRGYMRKHEHDGWKLGQCQFIQTEGKRIVVNMATQETYGKTGTHVDYDALKQCIEQVLDYCKTTGEGLAIPRVGAGLAGGDWARIEEIIRDCLVHRDVEVDVYSLD
jgi:O-acetyl-ADP-ribose deacetylase (regulator of RNase III)